MNASIEDKEYKIFTSQFDEISMAENLDSKEEIHKLRKSLDQQLTSFQDLITKLANKLQRLLLAKQVDYSRPYLIRVFSIISVRWMS